MSASTQPSDAAIVAEALALFSHQRRTEEDWVTAAAVQAALGGVAVVSRIRVMRALQAAGWSRAGDGQWVRP